MPHAETPLMSGRAKFWIIVIVIGVIFGLVQDQQDSSTQRDLENQGYVDTGQTVSGDDCAAQGGTVRGNFCLVP